ncbi:MAG: hypothetical protein AB7F86_09660 [Bdellovibrionales bacterium]
MNARFKPEKSGVVKVPKGSGPGFEQMSREDASVLMRKFCGNDRAEIIEINAMSTPTGSTSAPVLGVTYSQTTFDDSAYVHFKCVPNEVVEFGE